MILEEDVSRIRNLIRNARKLGQLDDLRPIMEIELQRVAKECAAHMDPIGVRDYCMKLNSMLDGYFNRDEVDALLAVMWEEWESKIGRRKNWSPAAHLTALEKEVKSWGKNFTFEFGISQLDRAWGGLMPGELAVLVGSQGSMKTSLAVHGIITFLQRNPAGRVLLFSLDMSYKEMTGRFLIQDLGVDMNELYGMMQEDNREYLDAKARFDAWEANRLMIMGNEYKSRWTIAGVEKQAAMRLPSLMVIDFLTCLKRPGQSDLEAVEEIMPRLQGLTQKLGIKTVILSQMSRSSKSDQLKGVTGGHSKGGGIVEELAHAEIELIRDRSETAGEPDPIIATVTKTRRGIAGASFALDYKGKSMEFTGRAQRVQREKDRKPMFSCVNALRG